MTERDRVRSRGNRGKRLGKCYKGCIPLLRGNKLEEIWVTRCVSSSISRAKQQDSRFSRRNENMII